MKKYTFEYGIQLQTKIKFSCSISDAEGMFYYKLNNNITNYSYSVNEHYMKFHIEQAFNSEDYGPLLPEIFKYVAKESESRPFFDRTLLSERTKPVTLELIPTEPKTVIGETIEFEVSKIKIQTFENISQEIIDTLIILEKLSPKGEKLEEFDSESQLFLPIIIEKDISKIMDRHKYLVLNIANNFISYFKYEYKYPQLKYINLSDFKNIELNFYDENSNKLTINELFKTIILKSMKNPDKFILSDFSKMFNKTIGSHDLSNNKDLKDISDKSDKDYDLVDKLLADASSGIANRNFRRAIIELTTASEIAIKRAFFGESDISMSTFEYVEDISNVNIPLIQYTSKVASNIFGKNLKEEFPKVYESIDHLIRCRNKVAHRGKLIYKNTDGKTVSVNTIIMTNWWMSVNFLIKWLEDNRKNLK